MLSGQFCGVSQTTLRSSIVQSRQMLPAYMFTIDLSNTHDNN